MIRHIVAFRLVDPDAADRAERIRGIHDRLTALVGTIPGLTGMHVEPDLGEVAGHWDLVLVSEHDTAADLAAYQTHPSHVEASGWVGQFIAERAVVDYALPMTGREGADHE